MSTQQPQQPSPTEQARQYIDDVMQINTDFGMSNTTSEDVYNAAVTEAAEAFSWIRP
jgi:hypothetical protein